MIAQRLVEPGITLPPVFPPAGNYLGCVNGASDVLVEIFGAAGRHTRSAVGMAALPFDIAVELELTAKLRPAA